MNETLTVPIGEQEHLKEFFRAMKTARSRKPPTFLPLWPS